ncbi:ATP-binding protein [Corynebacterium diphtheriae DSM 43988]|nr:ATP-binding protein [Corynebacterium diphtheriae DSM 43988]
MRIRSLEIEHMRAITHLVLTDLPSNGVIVISGENERGKSTIMEAIKLVLGENHDTNKQSVKAIQPKGHDVGTRICLEADLGPVRFRVSKVFNKRKVPNLRFLNRNQQITRAKKQTRNYLGFLMHTLTTTSFLRCSWNKATSRPC